MLNFKKKEVKEETKPQAHIHLIKNEDSHISCEIHGSGEDLIEMISGAIVIMGDNDIVLTNIIYDEIGHSMAELITDILIQNAKIL